MIVDGIIGPWFLEPYEDWKPPGKAKKPKPRQKSPEEQFQEAKNRCFRILADYLHLLREWRKDYVYAIYIKVMSNKNKTIHEFDFNLICEYFSNVKRSCF